MAILTQTTDDKARINLPKEFANATVLIEQIGDTELRLRKARVIAEDDIPFVEETMSPLTDRDRDLFLDLLENPPPANAALRQLLSTRSPSSQSSVAKEGNTVADLVSLSWEDFLNRVCAEQHPVGRLLMHERLEVIRVMRQLFAQSKHFRDIEYVDRRKIAGLYKSENPNFLLFGSMQWVGLFKRAIKDNNEGVSHALDEIPLDGEVTRDQFRRFADRFLIAFKRAGMALASRLLAMKRPDTFVCVNNQNRDGLVKAFRVGLNKDPETYWELIERIRASVWWKAPTPATGDEREVWKARTAFLDALFFSGTGLDR